MIRRICIVDTETTGLDPKKDAVIEIGAILYSLEYHTTIASYSSLVFAHGNAAEAINGIPPAALRGVPEFAEASMQLRDFAVHADAMVAHNASFDRGFLPDMEKPWICTKSDFKWPKADLGASLVVTALAHGLGVSSAHRALTDCRLIARLLERVHEMGLDVGAMLARGLRPKGKFVANVSYDERELAKKAGFSWVPESKSWIATIAREDAAALPFKVREVA